jgi:hypothetical protein
VGALPSTLETHLSEYKVRGKEVIGNVECLKLERPGIDVLWFSPKQGYFLFRRDRYYGPGKPIRERMLTSAIKEVGNYGWVPQTAKIDRYFGADNLPERVGKLDSSMEYQLTSSKLGVRDEATKMEVPGGSFVSDLVHNRNYFLPREGQQSPLAETIETANRALRQGESERLSIWLIWVNAAVVLGAAILFLWRRLRQPITPPSKPQG